MKKLTQRFQEIQEMLGGICDEVYHYWGDAKKSNCYTSFGRKKANRKAIGQTTTSRSR